MGFPQGHDFHTKKIYQKNVSKAGKSYIYLKAPLPLFPQRRMSSDISPSLVNWMTSMMTMRLQVILEHMPITQEQIQAYIVHTKVKVLPAWSSLAPVDATLHLFRDASDVCYISCYFRSLTWLVNNGWHSFDREISRPQLVHRSPTQHKVQQ